MKTLNAIEVRTLLHHLADAEKWIARVRGDNVPGQDLRLSWIMADIGAVRDKLLSVSLADIKVATITEPEEVV